MNWKHGLTAGSMTIVGMGMIATIGCDEVEQVVGEIVAPGATLNRVDLIDAPSAKEFARYSCHRLLDVPTELCKQVVGNNINPDNMRFSFDIVFDLQNNNEKVPIPLVEILLGTRVYESQDLGTVCISFCDPDVEDCTPAADAEAACDVESAQEVSDPVDLVPTVDELTNLAETALAGELEVNNEDFRVIPAQQSIETHILFDFNIATMLNLGENILKDLAEDFLDNRTPAIDIPYSMEGNLFFNVPEMGRYAAGFGPLTDTWVIQ